VESEEQVSEVEELEALAEELVEELEEELVEE
jgi:hypothetical protein